MRLYIADCIDLVFFLVDAYDNARFLCEQYYSASPRADFHIHKRKNFYDIFNICRLKLTISYSFS